MMMQVTTYLNGLFLGDMRRKRDKTNLALALGSIRHQILHPTLKDGWPWRNAELDEQRRDRKVPA